MQTGNLYFDRFSAASYLHATGQTRLGNLAAFASGGGRVGYVFWNAAIQGTTNFARVVKKGKGKGAVAIASFFLLGSVIPYLVSALGSGDDDDENNYWNIPEAIRRKNICFKTRDNWITIPLPIEFSVAYGLGELGMTTMLGRSDKSGGEIAVEASSILSRMLPLDMNDGASAFIPSSAKPVTEVWMNKDWTGLPIYKDSEFNKDDPEHTKVFGRTNGLLVAASKKANELTGGDDYKKGWIDNLGEGIVVKFNNPAVVEHLLEGYFGGYTTTVNKLWRTGETVFGDRDFDWANIPIASRVTRTADERTAMRNVSNNYYKIREEAERTNRLSNDYRKDTRPEYQEKYGRLVDSPEFAHMVITDHYEKQIKVVREELKDKTLSDEEIRAKKAVVADLQRQTLDAVKSYDMIADEEKKRYEKAYYEIANGKSDLLKTAVRYINYRLTPEEDVRFEAEHSELTSNEVIGMIDGLNWALNQVNKNKLPQSYKEEAARMLARVLNGGHVSDEEADDLYNRIEEEVNSREK